jgi:hypothetical protein
MKIPDPPSSSWLDFGKLALGFFVVLVLAALAAVIGIGDVQEKSSFGLQYILGGLTAIASQFAMWAFTPAPKADRPKDSSDISS